MNFPKLKFVRRMVELNSRTLWCALALGIALLAKGCITAAEVLYSDPVFSTALKEFDRLHAQDKLPGLASHQKPRSLQAYEMSEGYMGRDYYRLWRQACRECSRPQVVVADKDDGSASAYFFCLDAGQPKLINTLYQSDRRAPWSNTP